MKRTGEAEEHKARMLEFTSVSTRLRHDLSRDSHWPLVDA